MIRSFLHKGLREFFEHGASQRVSADLAPRARGRLLVLHAASSRKDLAVPGFDCHPLRGYDPTRYAIKVSGPWRITFEFKDGDSWKVDLEQYH